MPGLARILGGACAAAVLVAVPAEARAGASARLVYVRGPGAEECPGEQALRAAVGMRLGYDPFFPWAAQTLIAEISGADGAFRVDLKLIDDQSRLHGSRQMSVVAADCAAAIDAMGLTVSLTIDPSSVTGPTAPPAPVPAATPEESTREEPPAPPNPVSAPKPSSTGAAGSDAPSPARGSWDSVAGHLGVGGIGSLGAGPAPTVGGTVSAGLSWGFLSADLEGRADLPASASAEGTRAHVRSSLLAGAIVPCAHLGVAFGCAVVSGGSMRATSVDIASPRDAAAPWWAAGGRAGAELPLGGTFSLRAYAELLATLTPNVIVIDGAVAYRFPRVSGGLGAGLAWRFL